MSDTAYATVPVSHDPWDASPPVPHINPSGGLGIQPQSFQPAGESLAQLPSLEPVAHDPFAGQVEKAAPTDYSMAGFGMLSDDTGYEGLNRLFKDTEAGPRHQTWPEHLARSGFTLAHDVGTGLVPDNTGLRREDFTDIPPPSGPTKDSTWLGRKLGWSPVAWQPMDEMIERAQDMAGMAMSGPLGAGAKVGESVLGSGPMGKLKKVTGPVESDPGYVYHATSADRVRDIAQGGLNTHKPNEFTDQNSWPDGSTQKRNYFTPTAEHTWQFAPEDGSPALLRVAKDDHPLKQESTGDLYSTKQVPPSKIEALTDDGWKPLTDLAQKEPPTLEPIKRSEPLPYHDSNEQMYIRFGDLPKGGNSKVGRSPNMLAAYLGEVPGKKLEGTSVLPVKYNRERNLWQIDDSEITEGGMASIDELLYNQKEYDDHLTGGGHGKDESGKPTWSAPTYEWRPENPKNVRPIHLVTGEETGHYGTDGEPLLKNVQLRDRLKLKDLLHDGYFDPATDIDPRQNPSMFGVTHEQALANKDQWGKYHAAKYAAQRAEEAAKPPNTIEPPPGLNAAATKAFDAFAEAYAQKVTPGDPGIGRQYARKAFEVYENDRTQNNHLDGITQPLADKVIRLKNDSSSGGRVPPHGPIKLLQIDHDPFN